MRADAGYASMRAADRAIKGLESLRNHLAHAQDIVTHDWPVIVEVAGRLDRIMTRVAIRDDWTDSRPIDSCCRPE